MKKILIGVLSLSVIPSMALAVDMPNIKAGVWEVDVEVDGRSQGKITQCVDANTAQDLLKAGQKMLGDSCQDVKVEKKGASYVSSVECNLGISKMNSTTTLTGDFNNNYVSVSNTTFDPPMMGKESTTSKSDGRWVGPCKKGMRPGDTIMSDGRKMNLIDMMQKLPDMAPKQGSRQMPDMKELQKLVEQGRK